jgi:predicted small metal-binding protein
MDKVAEHTAKKHAVHTMSDTIVNEVKQKIKKT